MKIFLSGKSDDLEKIEFYMDDDAEKPVSISKASESIGYGISHSSVTLELNNKQSDNQLREKLTKEYKRLQLALPKVKKMRTETRIQTTNQFMFSRILPEKLVDKCESLSKQIVGIEERLKLIKWALSKPDKK